jgi:hypothetical protein
LNLTDINFGYCKKLDVALIFDVIFKFEGLTKLSLAGLDMVTHARTIRRVDQPEGALPQRVREA